jgi:hypothetical protein
MIARLAQAAVEAFALTRLRNATFCWMLLQPFLPAT